MDGLPILNPDIAVHGSWDNEFVFSQQATGNKVHKARFCDDVIRIASSSPAPTVKILGQYTYFPPDSTVHGA